MRVVAFLPKAHRETRGRAAILPACAAIQSIGGKMKLRVVVSLLGVLALFGGVARAQERQTVEVFAGYSYLRANPATSGVNGFSLNGGSASVSYNVNNWLSGDRKSTRLNSSHLVISYAVFCLKKKRA